MSAARHASQGLRANETRDELELLKAVAAGDEHAFKRLYLIYQHRLGAFLMRVTGRLDLTEELINDVMFVVWQKAATFRNEAQVSTWIIGIAYRQALKKLRRRRFGPPPLPAGGGQEHLDAAAVDSSERRETREWIDSALAALPAKQRLVIELAYFMGYSCEEIARVAGCPVGTVKTRMYNARIRLRATLARLAGDRPVRASSEERP